MSTFQKSLYYAWFIYHQTIISKHIKQKTSYHIHNGKIPPRYDEAFKTGAAKMVTEQGCPSKEVASELRTCTS